MPTDKKAKQTDRKTSNWVTDAQAERKIQTERQIGTARINKTAETVDRKTDRQNDTKTNRQTYRQRARQKKYTDRNIDR
jgi:hypothetical protein